MPDEKTSDHPSFAKKESDGESKEVPSTEMENPRAEAKIPERTPERKDRKTAIRITESEARLLRAMRSELASTKKFYHGTTLEQWLKRKGFPADYIEAASKL